MSPLHDDMIDSMLYAFLTKPKLKWYKDWKFWKLKIAMLLTMILLGILSAIILTR